MRKRLKDGGVAVDTNKLFIEDADANDSEVNDGVGRAAAVTTT